MQATLASGKVKIVGFVFPLYGTKPVLLIRTSFFFNLFQVCQEELLSENSIQFSNDICKK